MAPPDAAVREALRTRLGETMFVEAGAGSGKTTCLVDRFVALVESGVDADRIAAITFTEKAAGELADRIRTELQKRSATSRRSRAALPALDRAAICTLHAFAQRLLNENPIEAGLPPKVTVLDEIASQLAFEMRWEAFQDRIIADPDLERPLRLLLALGARMAHLHQVALQFGANWDLVEERLGGAEPDVPPLELDHLLDEIDRAVAMSAQCWVGDDNLLLRLGAFAEWAEQLRTAVDDDSRLERLGSAPSFKVERVGQAPNWPDINVVRAQVQALESGRDEARDEVLQACLERIAAELARFTVDAAGERRQTGELEFHDLLVLARAVLRDPMHGVEVRAAAAQRYQRLLLDEFQDTDPIQVELAVLIASTDPEAGTKRWWEVEVEPGRLFFVGDPKQSIYRFRRADIAMFLRARDRFGAVGGEAEQLTTNFRTTEPILEWVNRTFAQLICEDGESQPAYVPLDPWRSTGGAGAAVSFMGCEPHPRAWRADALREAEARDVAAAIRQVMAEDWHVCDASAGGWRRARWSDVAVLLPARTSLRALERALEREDIPYRAETSSLVYGTGEIRDLLMVARAVEDPTDSLAVVAALRTAAFGCGDDDLYVWRRTHGGRWDHQGRLPSPLPDGDIVGQGLSWLGRLHRERLWLAPSQILERIVRERRLMEVAFVDPRPRDLWRRLRFVVDQCRAWEEAGGTTLREYLAWGRLQSAEGARVIETVLPETDDDAVRILTIHGAKGLEFPVTVLSGLTTQLNRRRGGVQVLFPPGGGWAVHLKKDLETAEFADQQPIEEQMDWNERLRLLYVAATRARDHLLVSVHRKEGSTSASTAAELFYQHGWDPARVSELGSAQPVEEAGAPPQPVEAVGPAVLPSFAEWEQERSAAFFSASRPVAVSATRLAEEAARALEVEALAGSQKDPRDIDLPPWQKGRYGSAIGRAVHAVLQTVDLSTGSGLAPACAAQAAAEGVLGSEGVIEAFCRSGLAADVVGEAARLPHWREVYVGIPYGDGVLEGYIDLLYRSADGLVVVDYKTDRWRGEADLQDKVERYRVQLQAYGRAATEAAGEAVAGLVLLFLSARGGARAVTVAPDPTVGLELH
jgi:ATP-dependent exoDNAse (exonuclease V) beta subunit